MCGQLFFRRGDNDERYWRANEGAYGSAAICGASGSRDFSQCKRGLTTRHRKIDVRQYPRVEQGTVQLAPGVINAIALAQSVQIVALPRMHGAGERERIQHAAKRRNSARLRRQPCEFCIQKRYVERRVVNYELRIVDKEDELLGDLRKFRLAGEKCWRNAVNRQRSLVDLALGIEVFVESASGRPPVHELHA